MVSNAVKALLLAARGMEFRLFVVDVSVLVVSSIFLAVLRVVDLLFVVAEESADLAWDLAATARRRRESLSFSYSFMLLVLGINNGGVLS